MKKGRTEMETRGVRNCNPCNIRPGSAWVGMRPVQSDKGFVQFTEMKWGVRAAFKLLRNYSMLYGANSIDKIVKRWAPASDGNNVEAYINHMTSHTGLGRFEMLLPYERNKYKKIVKAMAIIESKYEIPNSMLDEAWRLV